MKKVLTIGTFDLLHIGHLDFLRSASEGGGQLIVGVISDELVELFKGSKPAIPAEARAYMLSELSMVEAVLIVDSTDYAEIAKHIRPQVLALSEDHRALRFEKMAAWVEKDGGQVIRIPRSPRESTSAIKRRIIEANRP